MCDNFHPCQCVLRGEMDTLVCIVFIAFSLLVIAGSIEIENCNDKFIDILEDANNTILCKGFPQNDTIEWSIERDGQEKQRVATCDPNSYCFVPPSDHFAVERSPSHSTLFYQQYDRDKDAGTKVFCERQFPVGPWNASCTFNVIKTHTQKPTRGTTPASSSPAFLPATDNVDSTNSPGVSLQTTTDSVDSTSSPDVSLLTTKDNVDYTSPETQEENDLPVGATAGGIVAVVAVVIIVVVVVVVFVRKKRKQKPAGSAHGSGNDNATDNDDFEEHVSPMVFTSDGPDASQEIDENTYEIPARRPPNAEPEHVYNVSNTAATTSTATMTPSKSMETTPGDLHHTTSNKHRGQGNNLGNVHHNPVYVNKNQHGEESSGMQQRPTYANDHPETAQGYVDANRDSNPYYSDIRDTGIN